MRAIDSLHLHSRWAELVRGFSQEILSSLELDSVWLHIGQLDCMSYPKLGCSEFFTSLATMCLILNHYIL